jgi:pimeloyl-ACP methyl ester carboxylesterase/DNA-binding winged helix-turn-helix (wHTH) protein
MLGASQAKSADCGPACINSPRGRLRPLAEVIFFCYFSDTVSFEHSSVAYEFGLFRLEPREHRLVREGCAIPLTGKAFATLCVLVQQHGTLVPKQELMDAVWPDSVVEENSLDRNISALRKALGESFIETVPRAGYRFVAAVRELAPKVNGARHATSADDSTGATSRQEIRFCTTADKVRLAYSTIGSGYPLLRVANCFNHLDFEWESPIWQHYVRDLAKGHSIVRYDGRGNGISEWNVEDISFDAWVNDLGTVVDAAGLSKFAILGMSQGAAVAIAYTVLHPEQVSHLILCGGYSRGVNYRERPDAKAARLALETLVEVNWGKSNPPYFQMVTNLYIPEHATPEDQSWFKDLQGVSVSTANLVKFMRACDAINVRPLLPSVSVPTIVFHSDRDRIAPPEEGRILASEIPGARFVPLTSANHLLLAEEPAWKVFRDEVEGFLRG